MTRFHVTNTFELPEQHLFVLAGSIAQGEIRKGMFVRIPLSSSHGAQFQIDSIEFARRHDGEDTCLCIKAGPELAKILLGFKAAGQTLDVTADPSQ